MLTYMLHAYIHSTLHYTTLHYNHYITYICFVATIPLWLQQTSLHTQSVWSHLLTYMTNLFRKRNYVSLTLSRSLKGTCAWMRITLDFLLAALWAYWAYCLHPSILKQAAADVILPNQGTHTANRDAAIYAEDGASSSKRSTAVSSCEQYRQSLWISCPTNIAHVESLCWPASSGRGRPSANHPACRRHSFGCEAGCAHQRVKDERVRLLCILTLTRSDRALIRTTTCLHWAVHVDSLAA